MLVSFLTILARISTKLLHTHLSIPKNLLENLKTMSMAIVKTAEKIILCRRWTIKTLMFAYNHV